MLDYSNISCGIRNLWCLSADRLVSIREVALGLKGGTADNGRLNPRFSQVMFSDFVESNRGQRIADWIEKRPVLGTITSSPVVVNRNTGNQIRTWIWTLPEGPAESVAALIETETLTP